MIGDQTSFNQTFFTNGETQAWYDLYIYADPADSTHDTAFVGLSDIYKTVNANAGTPNWTDVAGYVGLGNTHPDQHAMTSTGGSYYFGNDGGVWSSDGGTNFTDLNGNLSTLQFYAGDLGTSAAEGCTLAVQTATRRRESVACRTMAPRRLRGVQSRGRVLTGLEMAVGH